MAKEKIQIDLEPDVPASALSRISTKLGKALKEAGSEALEKRAGGGLLSKVAGSKVSGGLSLGASAIGAGLGAATGAAAIGAVPMILDKIGSFVSKANPAVMDRLSLAMDNVSAVIGHALTPVIQAMIPLVEMFGDFLASIIPSQAEMNVLMKEFTPLIDALREELQALAPVISTIIKAIIKFSAVLLNFIVKVQSTIFRSIAAILNAISGRQTGEGFKRTSRNAAYRDAQFVGGADLASLLQRQAFGAGLSLQETIANNTGRTASALEAQNAGGAAGSMAGGATGAAMGAVNSFGGAGVDFPR